MRPLREIGRPAGPRRRMPAGYGGYRRALDRALRRIDPRFRTTDWVQDDELAACVFRTPWPAGGPPWEHPDGFYAWAGFQFRTRWPAAFQVGLGLNARTRRVSGAARSLLEARVSAAVLEAGLLPPPAAWRKAGGAFFGLGARALVQRLHALWERNPVHPWWAYLSAPGPDPAPLARGRAPAFGRAVASTIAQWLRVAAGALDG